MDLNVFCFPYYLCRTFTLYLTFWQVVVGVATVCQFNSIVKLSLVSLSSLNFEGRCHSLRLCAEPLGTHCVPSCLVFFVSLIISIAFRCLPHPNPMFPIGPEKVRRYFAGIVLVLVCVVQCVYTTIILKPRPATKHPSPVR